MNDEQLSRLIQQHATRHAASDALRAAVRTQIALQAARADQPAAAVVTRRWLWHWHWPQLLTGFAAGAALTLLLAFGVAPLLQPHDLASELVAAHVRALKLGPLVEVASSDRHNVKPWFQGKLDYAPSVFDLAADGYPLLGGRIERGSGQVIAALAYASRQHMLSVYVKPSDGTAPPQRRRVQGFQTLHWAEAGMQVWVVSDQDATEIDRFAAAWRRHALAATAAP